MENKTLRDLTKLGLIQESKLERFATHVRDRDDVGVLRDPDSGIIFSIGQTIWT